MLLKFFFVRILLGRTKYNSLNFNHFCANCNQKMKTIVSVDKEDIQLNNDDELEPILNIRAGSDELQQKTGPYGRSIDKARRHRSCTRNLLLPGADAFVNE